LNTIWRPDTCDCKIEYTPRLIWVKTWNKCRLHKSLDGQILLDAVLAQNRRFNNSIVLPFIVDGVRPIGIIKENMDRIKLSKRVNKLRIKTEDLTNFDEELPHEQTLTFFQNLRRILRESPLRF